MTGGEPFVRFDAILQIATFAKSIDIPFDIITNARWCKTRDIGISRMSRLKALGLDSVSISFDRFHAPFLRHDQVRTLASVANELQLSCTVHLVDDGGEIAEPQIEIKLPTRTQKFMAVGAATSRQTSTHSEKCLVSGRCPNTRLATVWADGSVVPCCAITTHAQLCIGNIYNDDAMDILTALEQAQKLKLIRTEGLLAFLRYLPSELADQIISKSGGSTCRLCYEIMDVREWNSVLSDEAPGCDIVRAIFDE
jgi:hypothetical protein